MELDSNAHSVFLLHYHLVLVVKYRRQVFDTEISKRAKEIFGYISPKYNITLEEWNHDKDHVHILFKAHPNSEISKFINAYKSASGRLLKKEFPQIRQKLWKECFWSQSFCLITTGGVPIEVIKNILKVKDKKNEKGSDKMANKAYKFRIYPNAEQKVLFAKTFGCTRLVYNHWLDRKIKQYETDKTTVTYTACAKEMAQLKKTSEFSFLQEVDSVSLQQSLRHLDTAFQNFFKQPKTGFPRFKSKKQNKNSYSTVCINGNINITNGCIKLPKIGIVKLK